MTILEKRGIVIEKILNRKEKISMVINLYQSIWKHFQNMIFRPILTGILTELTLWIQKPTNAKGQYSGKEGLLNNPNITEKKQSVSKRKQSESKKKQSISISMSTSMSTSRSTSRSMSTNRGSAPGGERRCVWAKNRLENFCCIQFRDTGDG